MMPISNVRDTLGDFVNQYTGFAQTTTTLGLANGVPQQTLADPFPANQSGDRAVRTGLRPLHRTSAAPSASTSTSCGRRSTIASTVSYQKEIWARTVVDASYFFNSGTRVPYDINLNMADPAFRYEQKTAAEHAGRQPVPQLPDARQVPRPAAQHRDGRARQPAGAVSAVRRHHADQHRRPADADAHVRAARAAAVHQRASASWSATPGTTRRVRSGSTTSRSTGAARPAARGLGMAADRHCRCIA